MEMQSRNHWTSWEVPKRVPLSHTSGHWFVPNSLCKESSGPKPEISLCLGMNFSPFLLSQSGEMRRKLNFPGGLEARRSYWMWSLPGSWCQHPSLWQHPGGSAGKESACNVGDQGLISGFGRSPGEGKGYPLQYSGLENSMDHTVHGVTKSWTWLSDFYFTLYMYLMFSSKWFMCFFNVSFDFTLIYFSSHSQGEATLLQSFFKIISFYCI